MTGSRTRSRRGRLVLAVIVAMVVGGFVVPRVTHGHAPDGFSSDEQRSAEESVRMRLDLLWSDGPKGLVRTGYLVSAEWCDEEAGIGEERVHGNSFVVSWWYLPVDRVRYRC